MTPNDIPNLSEVLAAFKAGTATFDDVREAARRHRFSTIDTMREVRTMTFLPAGVRHSSSRRRKPSRKSMLRS